MERHNKVTDKYTEAVSLYATTGLSIKEICERTQVAYSAFIHYLCRNHRDLIIKRHNLDGLKNVKLRGTKGQTTAAHLKYHDAIVAADSMEYIEFNVSQIARIFGLEGTPLGNQLKRHYPEVIPRREAERKRLGIADNIHHGVRPWCEKDYAGAVELLRTTDMTIKETAEACGVSFRGLRSHILYYHKDLEEHREKKRAEATRSEKVRGKRTGAWTIHEPTEEITQKYAEAVELYRTTSMHLEDIAAKFGLNKNSLRSHIRFWNPELIVERRGFEEGTKLSDTKRYKKATVEKYAEAIEILKKDGNLSTSAVSKKLGLHSEVFRAYLREHDPELVRHRGMTTAENGKRVGVKSSEKYAEAIRLYGSTTESLKSIAERLGLVYISLGNYVRRNHPDLIERHNALSVSWAERFAPGIEMLRTTDKTIGTVMSELGYNEYFRVYVKEHHPELLSRKTVRKVCANMPAKIRKYAEAVRLLETSSDNMREIAERLELNYSSLRKYMYKHHPEVLKKRNGRETTDGKGRSSEPNKSENDHDKE